MILEQYKSIKAWIHQIILFFSWWLIRFYLKFQKTTPKKTNKVFIFPSDPDNLIGAKGDEAMLLAAVEQVQLIFPNCQLIVNCTGINCQTVSKQLQLQIMTAWKNGIYLLALTRLRWMIMLVAGPSVTSK